MPEDGRADRSQPAAQDRFVARVHSQTRWRPILRFAAPVVIVLGSIAQLFFGLSAGIATLIGLALILTAWFVRNRRSARIATVELGAGSIRIIDEGFGPALQVKGRQLRGASAAHFDGKTLVSLDDRSDLYGIEAHNPEDASRLRSALGIGHFGFGEVRVPLTRERLSLLGSCVLPLLLLGTTAGAALVALMWWAVGATIARSIRSHAELVMDGGGITLGGIRFRYEDIRSVMADGSDLVIEHAGGLTRVRARGLSATERAHVAAQLQDASRRARGRIAPPPEIPEQITTIAQSQSDPAAFIAALDSNAERLLQSAGYRGGTMTEGELWQALENHDAPREVRCAAGRMLLRSSKSPDAQARIERAARSSREVATERLILAAVRPLDEAVREMEAIREAEIEKGVHRSPMHVPYPAPTRPGPGPGR